MSKKRFVDIGRKFKVDGHAWGRLGAPQGHTCVVCPNCHKMGSVTSDENSYYFKCHSCVKRKEVPRYKSEYVVEGKCEPCANYFRITVAENLKQFKVLRVHCPRCNTLADASTVRKLSPVRVSYAQEIIKGKERFTGYPLYFLDALDGKPIWALNREHLEYLINYIEADLRVEPWGKHGQAWAIPKFMKLAKNRQKVLKALKRLREK